MREIVNLLLAASGHRISISMTARHGSFVENKTVYLKIRSNMKKLFILLGLTMILTSAGMAQTVAKPALPGNLIKYEGQYPADLMKVTPVKARLKTLLGKRYRDFEVSISVQGAITKVGDFLFSSGCQPHACTISEAAFVIDLKNKRIHVAIYENDVPTKFFNEDKAPTPQVLLDWVEELKNS